MRQWLGGKRQWILGLAVVAIGAMVIANPWILLLVFMMVGQRVPDVRSDSDFVWQTLNTSGPGYANVVSLGRQGDDDTPNGIRIPFQIDMVTVEGVQTCEGTLVAIRGDPNFTQIQWANADCEEWHHRIFQAHEALKSTEGSHFWQEEDLVQATEILGYWVQSGRIRVEDIQDPSVRTGVYEWLLEER